MRGNSFPRNPIVNATYKVSTYTYLLNQAITVQRYDKDKHQRSPQPLALYRQNGMGVSIDKPRSINRPLELLLITLSYLLSLSPAHFRLYHLPRWRPSASLRRLSLSLSLSLSRFSFGLPCDALATRTLSPSRPH